MPYPVPVSTAVTVLLLSLLVIIFSIHIIKHRKNRKKMLFSFAATLITIFAIESALYLMDYGYAKFSTGRLRKIWASSPVFNGQDWAADLWKEHQSAWQPKFDLFTGWKREEFHGKYVNVDQEGVRKTWNPDGKLNPENGKTVFMFGGSSMWGLGARDYHTIPSCFSKLLDQKNLSFRIRNYGEYGYVILQEMIYLSLLLKDGQRPDYVIFYDGFNEIDSALENGKAGLTYNYREMQDHFISTQKPIWRHAVDRINYVVLLDWSKTKEVCVKLIRKIYSWDNKDKTFLPPQEACDQFEQLAEDIYINYKNSFDYIEHLSTAYGFQYLCFWQPTIYSKKLTNDENPQNPRHPRHPFQESRLIYGLVTKKLKAIENSHFHDISDLLNGSGETYYIDYCHVSEKANQIIAEKMLDIFQKRFDVNPQ